jgi:hypothetical protein
LYEVIRKACDNAAERLFVAMPGRIEKYDSVRQCAEVKPMLKLGVVCSDGSQAVDKLPVLVDVPVVFPRGGGYFLTFPLAKGDLVLLIFIDRSIDGYALSTGQTEQEPVDLRTHDISDAVAIPGFYPFPRAVKDVVASGAAMGKESGAQLRFTGNTVEATSGGSPTASDFVALATKVASELSTLATAINSHMHPTAGTGAPSTPTPIPNVIPYVPGVVASTNLKAD